MKYPFLLNRRAAARVAFLTSSAVILLAAPVPILAGAASESAPKANYELAARWMAAKVRKLVFDGPVTPHWMETGDRFWYSYQTPKGTRFYIVDPAKKAKISMFDHAKMAGILTAATGIPYDSEHLPIRNLKLVKHDTVAQFEVQVPRDAVIPGEKKPAGGQQQQQQQGRQGGGQRAGGPPAQGTQANMKSIYFEYELGSDKLTIVDKPEAKPRWASVSPDGKTVVFARNHNLYMMDAENYEKARKKADDPSIVEVQLTKDGEEHYSYARRIMPGGIEEQQQDQQGEEQAARTAEKNPRVPAVMIVWSQDSKKFALVRDDQRKVKDLWVINSLANPRPTLETYRYAMPGEADVDQYHLELFDRDTRERLEVKAAAFKDQTLRISTAPPSARGREIDKTEPQWVSPTSDKLYFTRLSRDEHKLDVCVADSATGEVKPLIEERMNVYIDTKPLRLINNGTEMIHWSERDGWGHYYLYDSAGKLKNRITQGEFVTADLLAVDEKARTALITAAGREEGENVYYTHVYKVNLDGSGMKLLDPGDATHATVISDDGKYFIDTASRVDAAPKSVLMDAQGATVAELETTDVSALVEAGFKFPEPFKVKADDGITDLYGVMYKPFDFDPDKKYPIIAYVYPGPQTESVTINFNPRDQNIALAQLGFIVIQVGNRGGNPLRSKWYHTYGYGNLRDYGLADKKAAIEQLARRYPFIDIDRVGIWGHSGGGFMSTAAMLVYPDFFKVAVSESGNHENNVYNRAWSERHHGVREVTNGNGDVSFQYSIDRNSELAKNLKGHLLLSTGDIDNNVHPANTIRMADALIKANKRFDFVLLPGQRHSYGPEADYFFWIRADYFAKYLLGDFSQTVDIWELNTEKEQSGNKAQNGIEQQRGQQQQQQRRN
jgi:dipeptidyl-peptidase-4